MTHSPFMQLLEILSLAIFLNTFSFRECNGKSLGKVWPQFHFFRGKFGPTFCFFPSTTWVGKYAKLHKEKTFQEPFFFTNGFTRRRTYKEKFIRKIHVGTPYSITRRTYKEKFIQKSHVGTPYSITRRTYKEKFIRKSHVGTPYSIRSLPLLKEKEKDPTTTLSLH